MKTSFVKRFFPLGLAALIGLWVVTSSWDNYRLHPLKSAANQLLPIFSIKESRVVVSAKAMSAEESKRSFGHDLISRGVQPVHLTIENNTSNEYSLCPSSVDLARIEPSKIASKISRSAMARGIGYKIMSFFFWPMMIPSTIDGIRVMTHHKNLKKDLIAKGMRDEIVAPYSTFHRVLFVPLDQFEKEFNVTLIELEGLKATVFATLAAGTDLVDSPELPT